MALIIDSRVVDPINSCHYRDVHDPGPDILSAKTGHDLPVLQLAEPEPEVFAAYTAPDGGLTSISKISDDQVADRQVCPHYQLFFVTFCVEGKLIH